MAIVTSSISLLHSGPFYTLIATCTGLTFVVSIIDIDKLSNLQKQRGKINTINIYIFAAGNKHK